MATNERPAQHPTKSQPEPVDAGEPKDPNPFTPFTPPREAGVWILGPNGPTREE